MLLSVHSCQKSNLPIYQFKNKTLLTSNCQLFIIQSLFPYLLNFQGLKDFKIDIHFMKHQRNELYMGPQWICLFFMEELCLWSMNCKLQNLRWEPVQLCHPSSPPHCCRTRIQESRRWRSQEKEQRSQGWWWRYWWQEFPPFPPLWCSCSPDHLWDTRGHRSSPRCCPCQCSTTLLPLVQYFWLGFYSGCGRMHVCSNLDKYPYFLSWKKIPRHNIA